MDGIETSRFLSNESVFELFSSYVFSRTRNLNVKNLIFIKRLIAETEYHSAERDSQYIKETGSQLQDVNQKLNEITLKKLTKRHIGARINWAKDKVKS